MFTTEISPSSRAQCRMCWNKIPYKVPRAFKMYGWYNRREKYCYCADCAINWYNENMPKSDGPRKKAYLEKIRFLRGTWKQRMEVLI